MTAFGAAVVIFLPYVAHRKSRKAASGSTPWALAADSRRGVLWALYFAGLGIGFIFVEMVLIQRFGLYLGHPVYSLSVVLFALLLTSATGSLLSGRPAWRHALPRSLACLAVLLLLYALALPPLLSATRGLPIALRMAIAVVVIGPSGVLMGVPFASGVRRAGAESKPLVSWAWAANGGASVFGSTLAVLVSMTYGFTATLLGGAAAYALALFVFSRLVRARTREGFTAGGPGPSESGTAKAGSS
jgi:predicted MFS family arabinose efflux permease